MYSFWHDSFQNPSNLYDPFLWSCSLYCMLLQKEYCWKGRQRLDPSFIRHPPHDPHLKADQTFMQRREIGAKASSIIWWGKFIGLGFSFLFFLLRDQIAALYITKELPAWPASLSLPSDAASLFLRQGWRVFCYWKKLTWIKNIP